MEFYIYLKKIKQMSVNKKLDLDLDFEVLNHIKGRKRFMNDLKNNNKHKKKLNNIYDEHETYHKKSNIKNKRKHK